ncbi:MAG TPA: YaiI/YqxD family protein [Candidatus Competibacteraceae bacterium]|nr:YaiI/YqxD family protein [Candidatus Competibacteraceae bacterium]
MKIWIDADACPNLVKAIVFRAAQRLKIPVTLVANQRLPPPTSRLIDTVQVSACLDAADHYLLQHTTAGDLVITADIPLAAGLVRQGVVALNPRGELYTENNITARLASRNLMEELRATGVPGGGPAPYDNRDTHAFANRLDRWLTQCGASASGSA